MTRVQAAAQKTNPLKQLELYRQRLHATRNALVRYQEQLPSEDAFVTRQVKSLDDSLEATVLPDHYRVAVVGSFKVGKSSFINKVCDMGNLASVSTNPETATITRFTYAEHARARIYFLSRSTWEEMETLHRTEPDDPQARRYKRYREQVKEFDALQERNREAGKGYFERDHDQQLEEYLARDCEPIEIRCGDWHQSKLRKLFAAEIKKFVSSRDPLHCLVERVEIEAPIALIRNKIELIDTPGLDDTDIYRVRATEKEVATVDAILFLTRSGSSYSQSDKNFIVTQIRKRRLKSLRLAVTKVDETYEAAVKQAKADDEDIPTFEEHRNEELKRVRTALQETLEDILNKSDLTRDEAEYFTSMLADVEVFFTSSDWYDEPGTRARSGIPELQTILADAFQNADAVKMALKETVHTLETVSSQVKLYIQQQAAVREEVQGQKKVETELAATQELVTKRLRSFAKKIEIQLENARSLDKLDREHIKGRIQQISVYTQDVLDSFEASDLQIHWRTRREGNWLYLEKFAEQVANRTFASFESLIRRYQGQLLRAAKSSERSMGEFTADISRMREEHELFRHDTVALIESITSKLRIDETVLTEIIEMEQVRIVGAIDKFMDQDMLERIDHAKMEAALASGKGTTEMQNAAIAKFYLDFSMIVRPGFEAYLHNQLEYYLDIVSQRLVDVYRNLNAEIEVRLAEQRAMVLETLQRHEQSSNAAVFVAAEHLESELRDVLRAS